MAASSLSINSKTEKRARLDFEINLVPMIDLLSVCICFLLLTAVWTQTATIQVHSGQQKSQSQNQETGSRSVNEKILVMRVYRSSLSNRNQQFELFSDGQMASRFSQRELSSVKFGSIVSAFSTVIVAPETGASVQDVVMALDALRVQKVRRIQVEAGV